MKRLIKKLLNESLNEIVSGGEYIVYHGTNSDIQKFSDEFVGKEEATDQEGPGIYFTTLKEESEMYGKNLYSVKLTPRKLMDINKLMRKVRKLKLKWMLE